MSSLEEVTKPYGRHSNRKKTAAEQERLRKQEEHEQKLKSKNEAIRLEFEKHQREQAVTFSDSLKINEAKVVL